MLELYVSSPFPKNSPHIYSAVGKEGERGVLEERICEQQMREKNLHQGENNECGYDMTEIPSHAMIAYLNK